ncbi:hypothetical protein GM3708_1086 [Geminocystis sp. NIES-3708]|uniref:hypothetical protein n=1 Tax=Geminocystis sp. NIES-3708 TaxID=1615909 RepID=UPI0005FCBBAA|nr:hypothetical protein [Geminocystis sp. NIES-3708]BAQ60680.1 hypothetical protein GM3708_1086 [Geminocystis sp. NIES-3708]
MNFNIRFLNGFWGLLGRFSSIFGKFIPVYIIVFIAYGDRFLPSPLSDFSFQIRTSINQTLVGSLNKDTFKNDKYNNKKSDEVIKQIEK